MRGECCVEHRGQVLKESSVPFHPPLLLPEAGMGNVDAGRVLCLHSDQGTLETVSAQHRGKNTPAPGGFPTVTKRDFPLAQASVVWGLC